ncbi:MAG: phosphoserine phosphatase, partial [Hungatella hathewayi]|nr:phosphoserine phosphatase [Hungatella hathewayi]
MKRKKMKFRLQPKLIMGLVFMAVVLVLALTSVVVVVYRGQMEEQYGKVAFDEATIAAEMIDGDMVEKYYATGEKDAYYEKVAAALLRVKQTIGLKYFYVVVPEEDVMVYIWDVGEEGEEGVRRLLDTDSYYGG